MYTKIPKTVQKALRLGAVLLALWLGMRYLLPVLAPFVAAFAIAAALEGPVKWLMRRARLPRAVAAGTCVLGSLGAVCALLYGLCGRVLTELKGFVQWLPDMLENLSATFALWQSRLAAYFRGETQQYVQGLLEGFTQRLGELPERLSGKLLSWLPSVAAAAPNMLLFAVTMVIGAYFISASYPSLLRFLGAQLPERVREKARAIRQGLHNTIVRWFKAQFLMMLITFVELTIAFLLLGVNYSLLLALATAVIDALPVLGTGTVLIPWALYELLTGHVRLGVGLAVTYGAVTVLRSCIQAKLLGDQLGLHPLATLLSIYVGYQVWGVWGMLVFPIAAITLKQLNDGGMIHLWKTIDKGESDDRHSIQYPGGHGDEHSGSHEYPLR